MGVENHLQAVLVEQHGAEPVGVFDIEVPGLVGKDAIIGPLPRLVVAVKRGQVHDVFGTNGSVRFGNLAERLLGLGPGLFLVEDAQPVPATIFIPQSSAQDCSSFGSFGKYPYGPVSRTSNPASAISCMAWRGSICFSSSGNQTPH